MGSIVSRQVADLGKEENMHRNSHPMRRNRLTMHCHQRFPKDHLKPWALRWWTNFPRESVIESEFARLSELAQLEGILFLADEPLPLRKIASLMNTKDQTEVRQWIEQLHHLYESERSAFQVAEIAGGFQLLTCPAFNHWLTRFHGASDELKLSAPARETLAIIAYRQPITRADIEQIRGVQCSEVLRQLIEKNVIRITGRDDSLGRPVLYGTTKKFLQWLGLKNIRDLPRYEELKAT